MTALDIFQTSMASVRKLAIYTTTALPVTIVLPPLSRTHTHALSQLCCVLENQSNKTTANMSDQLLNCFPVYADLNQQNTGNYCLTRTLRSVYMPMHFGQGWYPFSFSPSTQSGKGRGVCSKRSV